MDILSSVNSGITNAVKDFLGLSISSIWMASNVVTFQLKLSFYFSNTFIIIDFYNHLTYSIVHQFNFIWNKQINFSNEDINLFYIFTRLLFYKSIPNLLIPAAIIGAPAFTIGIMFSFTYLYIYFINKHIKKQVF
jgi:hypothetical protein